MKRISLLSAPALLLILLLAPQAEAENSSTALQQHLKASYNTMVKDVRETEDPSAKREIIAGFLTRLDRSLVLVQQLVPESKPTHAQATRLRATLKSHLDELYCMDMQGGQAAGNTLNSFASYLQQDVEQADGIYLSAGALIIILIILIIVL